MKRIGRPQAKSEARGVGAGTGVDGSCSGAWAVGGRQASAVAGGGWSSTLTLAENVIRCRTPSQKRNREYNRYTSLLRQHIKEPPPFRPAPAACRALSASSPLFSHFRSPQQSVDPARRVIRRAPPDSIAPSP